MYGNPVQLPQERRDADLLGGSRLGQGGAVPYLLKQVVGCEEVDGEDHDKDAAIVPIVGFLTLSPMQALAHPSQGTILVGEVNLCRRVGGGLPGRGGVVTSIDLTSSVI